MATHHQGRRAFSGRSIEEYDDRYLDCRGGQHVYPPVRHYDVTFRGEKVIEYRRTRVCTQCGCERTDYFDGNMEQSRASTRNYPDGYLQPLDGVLITPAEARLEQVRRAGGPGRRGGLRAV